MKFGKTLLREKLEEKNFYEGVIFENEEVKKNCEEKIRKWKINQMTVKGVEIEKFKYLFKKLDEIAFPIKIKEVEGIWNIMITFIDNRGKEYYMIINLRLPDLFKYLIGRRNCFIDPFEDREFEYEISSDGNIVLIMESIIQLNENGNNKDEVVSFFYNSGIEGIFLKSNKKDKRIKIQCLRQNDEVNKEILKLLFKIEKQISYYYDVMPLLKEMLKIITNEKITIYIKAEIKEVYSEIVIENGFWNKYIYTEFISEEEICIHKKTFKKELKAFDRELI